MSYVIALSKQEISLDSTSIEQQVKEGNEFHQNNYILVEKHYYPAWVKFLGIFTLILFIFGITRFLWVDLPLHREISSKFKIAENIFVDQKYWNALLAYQDVINLCPKYKEAKIRMAQACFALSADNESLYYLGLKYLSDENYKDSEIKKIKKFLPEQYKKDFKSQFKTIEKQ